MWRSFPNMNIKHGAHRYWFWVSNSLTSEHSFSCLISELLYIYKETGIMEWVAWHWVAGKPKGRFCWNFYHLDLLLVHLTNRRKEQKCRAITHPARSRAEKRALLLQIATAICSPTSIEGYIQMHTQTSVTFLGGYIWIFRLS